MVLIDIAMPEINGVESIEAILKKCPTLPFLYMTGYVGPIKLDLSEQPVLKKPFTIAELAAKVGETLFPTKKEPRDLDNVVPLKSAARPAS